MAGVSSPGYSPAQRFFTYANLAAQLGIIVTGGLVRLTGSGLGCSTWPLCEPGSFTPVFHEASTWHPYIEFGNRTLTGVLVIFAAGLLWSLYRQQPERRDMRPLAIAVMGLIVIQAVVGGISVWMSLHPGVVGLHMALSLGLVALSALLAYRLHHGATMQPLARADHLLHMGLALALLLSAILGVVVTGTGPHSGDATRAMRFAIDPLVITRIHSLSAWLVVAVAVVIAIRRMRAAGHWPTPWLTVLFLLAAQGLLGYIQYATGLNRGVILAHMLGSGLLTVAVTWAIADTYTHRAPVEQATKSIGG